MCGIGCFIRSYVTEINKIGELLDKFQTQMESFQPNILQTPFNFSINANIYFIG